MILGKVPYRGYHLVLLQHKETFQIRVLDGRNNDVQLSLSTVHATEEDALEEARRKVEFYCPIRIDRVDTNSGEFTKSRIILPRAGAACPR